VKSYVMISGLIGAMMLFNACSANDSESVDIPIAPGNLKLKERWASSENLQITINQQNTQKIALTSDHQDYKPTWSKTGDKLTFFRFVSKGRGFHTWRTKICVVNIDGTGFRELTIGDYPDFNPTWTRDDSNLIIITEMNTDYTYEYPRWTKDESCVIYDSNKSGKYQIYAYHLEDKTTTRISPDIKRDYRFGNFENLPK